MIHLYAIVGAALAALFVTACAGSGLDADADKFEPPAAFAIIEDVTSSNSDQDLRNLRYSTDLSQNEACRLAESALQQWTTDQVNSDPETEAAVCSFSVRNPSDHSVNLGQIRISRASIDGERIQDADAAGGVHVISVLFSINK